MYNLELSEFKKLILKYWESKYPNP